MLGRSAVRLLVFQALVCLTLACSSFGFSSSPAPAPPPPPVTEPFNPPGEPTTSALPDPEPPPEILPPILNPPVMVEAPEDPPAGSASGDAELSDGQGAGLARDGRPGDRATFGPPLVDKTLRFVRLFFGTNRVRNAPCAAVAAVRWDAAGACRPGAYFGGLLAAPASSTRGLDVGTLTVTFPPDHAPGKIERPFQVFTVSLRDEDPDRDVVISELRSFGGDHAAWARALRPAAALAAAVLALAVLLALAVRWLRRRRGMSP